MKEKLKRITKVLREWLTQPSTRTGFITLASILTYLGVNLNVEQFTTNVIMVINTLCMLAVGGAGLYDVIRDEFSKKKEDKQV